MDEFCTCLLISYWIFYRYSHLASSLWAWSYRKRYSVEWLTWEWPLHGRGVWQGGWSWLWSCEQLCCQWNAGKQQWNWHIVSFHMFSCTKYTLKSCWIFFLHLSCDYKNKTMVAHRTAETHLISLPFHDSKMSAS